MENEDRGHIPGSDAEDVSSDPPMGERSVVQRIAAAVSSGEGGGFGHKGGETNSQRDLKSKSRWRSARQAVPVMRRRFFSGEVPLRAARPPVTLKGLAGSAFRAMPRRDGVEIIGAKRPASNELDRHNKWSRSALPRTALRAVLQSSSAPSGRNGSATSTPPPSEGSPGVGPRRTRGGETNARGGVGGKPPQNTRESTTTTTNPAALRFRLRDFTPQRKPRSSFGASSLRGGGSVALVAWQKPLPSDDAVSHSGDSKERGVHGSRWRGARSLRPKARCILGAASPESEGVGVTTAPRKTVEERAKTSANAQVGNTLLSVIHPGAAWQHKQVGGVTSANKGDESSAEFGFPDRTTGRRAAAAATSVARLNAITFARPVPAKRSRASCDQDADMETPVPADEDSLGVFEFRRGQSPSGRLMRRSPRKLVNSLESYSVPPVEPMEVLGSSAGDSHELRGAAGDSRSRGDYSDVPSPAPAAKGFDMSLFRKAGEWKCEICLVKNPPGGDKCVSCETPKPGSVQAGGATAASDSGSSGLFAGSVVGGALFASSAPTIPSVTFGVQDAAGSGRGSFGEAQKSGATGVSPTMTQGFDMSLFVKPGEWKCDACLVRNAQDVDKCTSCETPKSAIASPATHAGSLGGVAGNSSSPTQGFDMSLFRKAGEWKCEACLVKNPLGGDKCVSCETPKPGGVQAGGAIAASGSGSSGLFAGSTVGGALFASGAPTIPSFTFGVQAGVVSGGGSFGEAQKNGASTGVSPTVTKGFDMSLFVKPGEWKCDACLVRNTQDVDKCTSCETPKSAIASPATHAGSLGGVAGNSSSPTQGFDMSLFRKAGEWKCEACLVKNPPGGDKCVSCETPKPGGVQAGGATAASGSVSSGLFAGSTVGGALFASGAPTVPSFTFGVQAGVVSGGGSFGETQKNGASTGRIANNDERI